MASSVPWVAIVHSTEAYFCPVAASSNPQSKKLDQNAFQEVLELLGQELAQAISCDPDLSASIWLGSRIEVRWTKSRPEIREKIKQCLHRAGILRVEIQGEDAQLTAHRLGLAVSSLYEENVPLTGNLLSCLAAKENDADRFVGRINYLNQMGFSSDEICALLNVDEEDCDKSIFIIEAFDRADYLPKDGIFKKLTGNRTRFEAIHYVVSAMHNSDLLTKRICGQLLEKKGYARQLAWGISLLHGKDRSVNHEINSFLLRILEEGMFHSIFPTLEELVQIDYFHTIWNIKMLNANRGHIAEIQRAIDFLQQAHIPLTRNFCELIIGLVFELCPLQKEDVLFLAKNAQHSYQILNAEMRLRQLDFPLTKRILFFLVANAQIVPQILCDAYHMNQVVLESNKSKVSFFENDIIFLMENSMNAYKGAEIMEFLRIADIPLTRDNFRVVIANKINVNAIKWAIERLMCKRIQISNEIISLLLKNGTDALAVQELVQSYIHRSPSFRY